MLKNACKCKEKDCEECPEWIFTFADLVMLMMGFFVVLWVLKPAPGKEGTQSQILSLELLAGIREGFGYVPEGGKKDPVDEWMLMQRLKRLRGEGAGGRTTTPRAGAEGDEPEVLSVRKGSQAIVGSRVLFAAGDASLSPEAMKVLDQVAVLIRGYRNIMIVKGHTAADDFSENADSQQKLELSIRRAKAVADYLVGKGVSPDTLRVLGCSTYEPVEPRAYTAERRQLNRRVEVEAMASFVAEFQAQPEPAEPVGGGPGTRPTSAASGR